jgi:alcohol dehydrogenase (cytochrome c)
MVHSMEAAGRLSDRGLDMGLTRARIPRHCNRLIIGFAAAGGRLSQEDSVTTTIGHSVSGIALLRLATALGATALGLSGAGAAEVTYERLVKPEPGNWLMNHHDYGSHRFSALDAINKGNVKNLKLAFAVPLGGSTGNEYTEATPVVEDGFLYITDVWSVVYKIDVRSGTAGRVVWKMDPGTAKPDRNRGVALWGSYVISVTGLDGRVIATDKETGKVVWDKNLRDQPDLEITAAPLALKDAIIIGASGGDNGVRDWIASLDPKTGETQWKTFVIPAPGEPGSETWKDKNNAWRTGGGAMYVTGSYDPTTNLTYWGTGNPVPRYDSGSRPGDNLYTDSTLAFGAKDGKIQWHFQHTANDIHDYDTSGSQIIIDGKVNGDDRKLVVHVRSPQRAVPQSGAICRKGELDQGPRPQDRQADRLRPEPRRADL